MILALVEAVKNSKTVTAQMLNYKHIITTVLFLLGTTSFLFAQQKKGSVTEVKDPLIDSLIQHRITLTKSVSADGTPLVINGYRVQIFFGSNRQEAYDEQSKFKALYPEYNTYISYTQPNYRVKVGDFRTRMEAQRLLNELKPLFPTLFIFNEQINPSKADR